MHQPCRLVIFWWRLKETAGEEGGRIVAQGTPEQMARNKKSYTGQALAGYFANGQAQKSSA